MKRFCTMLAATAVAGLGLQLRGELVNGVQVVVHDTVITHKAVEDLTVMAARELRRDYDPRSEAYQKKLAEAEKDSQEELVDRQLILHDFKTAGYNMPESVIEDIVRERIRSQFGDRMTAAKSLGEKGMTIEKYREQVREKVILDAMRQKNISSEKIIISPHKVEAYYQAHRDEFKVADEVKLQMIVLNKSENPDAPQAKALAQEIVGRLKNGASFEEMAAVYSQRAQRTPGAEWFERSKLRKELADAAVNLKPGERSEIIDTPEACYLVKAEDKRPAHFQSLPDVRGLIEKTLVLEERSKLEKQWIERLRKKTYVRYF